MDKETLISKMEKSHRQFMKIVITIWDQTHDAPVLPQGWSIKDLLAHISFWEARVTRIFSLMQAGQLPDPQIDELSMDNLNAHNYQENRQRPWEEVLQVEETHFQALLLAVKEARENDLFDPERFAWTEGHPFVDWIEANTYGHYDEHLSDLPDVQVHI